MKRIRKGDIVVVLTGKDKGKQGTVTLANTNDQYVTVSGINLVKKHVKPNPVKGLEGGIISKEMPIHVSNVAIYNAKTKKAERIGFLIDEGKKIRVGKSSSQPVEQ